MGGGSKVVLKSACVLRGASGANSASDVSGANWC